MHLRQFSWASSVSYMLLYSSCTMARLVPFLWYGIFQIGIFVLVRYGPRPSYGAVYSSWLGAALAPLMMWYIRLGTAQAPLMVWYIRLGEARPVPLLWYTRYRVPVFFLGSIYMFWFGRWIPGCCGRAVLFSIWVLIFAPTRAFVFCMFCIFLLFLRFFVFLVRFFRGVLARKFGGRNVCRERFSLAQVVDKGVVFRALVVKSPVQR